MAITGFLQSQIDGFEEYFITEKGAVYNRQYDIWPWGVVKRLKTRVDRAGYITVRLSRDGQTFTKYIHRLLAEQFIANPLGLPVVNHKDGNRRNNTVQNLEWVTHKENVQHAYQNGLNSWAKKVLDTTTGTVFTSVREAAKACNLNYNTLCKRLQKNHPGYPLRYLG